MTGAHAGPQIFGATADERRIVETLYRAIGGEPDLLDEVLAPDWEDIPSIPGQPPGPEGLKPHITEFHRCFAAPSTGRPSSITIHEFHQIEDGRIVRSWHLEDLHGWIRRMGA